MKIKAKELERRSKAFSNACRRYGLKSTYQRAEIYRELASTEEHPDVETIYARVRSRIPAVSLDTVYRTLRLLEKKGSSHAWGLSVKERGLMQTVLTITTLSVRSADS